MVHSKEDLETAMEASEILFGKGTTETLRKLDEATFLSVFEGVPLLRTECRRFLTRAFPLSELLAVRNGCFCIQR